MRAKHSTRFSYRLNGKALIASMPENPARACFQRQFLRFQKWNRRKTGIGRDVFPTEVAGTQFGNADSAAGLTSALTVTPRSRLKAGASALSFFSSGGT